MPKILNIYRAYTASDIDSRSSNTCDHIVVNNTVECSNITISRIKTILGIGNNALSEICTSNNINKWSCFAPFVRAYVNQGTFNAQYTNEKPTSYFVLSDFAGYNHNAPTPQINSYNQNIIINSGSTPTFIASITIGELPYPSPVQGIAMAVFHLQNGLVGFTIIDISTLTDGVDFIVTTSIPLTSSTSFTAGFYAVDNLSQFLQSGSNVVCRIPNTTDITFNVTIRVPTYFLFEQNDWSTGTPTYSLTNGTVTWPGGSVNRDISYVSIIAEVYENNVGLVGSYTFWEGQYYANTYIPAETGYLGIDPIPDFGYSIMLIIVEGE